jgi:nitroreductase
MQAIDLLLTRRSGRALTAPAPDEATLALLFASAARAPDHGRLRPWRFIVVREAARASFGDVLAGYLRRTHPQAAAETLERERQKAFRAPMILVVAARCDGTSRKVPPVEQLLSAGAAAEAILLAAVALGFNGVWKTGAAAYDETVKASLGLLPTDAIVGFLYLGTEAAAERAAPAADSEWADRVSYWDPPG